jgi:hypothetical protein
VKRNPNKVNPGTLPSLRAAVLALLVAIPFLVLVNPSVLTAVTELYILSQR